MPCRCCPDLGGCRKHVGESDAVFEYFGGAFRERMPKVDFNGRGRGVEPKQMTHYKSETKAASTGVVELTRDNFVVYLSSHTYVDRSGNPQTLMCSCKPVKAAQRSHICRGCRCLGNCTLSCGYEGRCFSSLPPWLRPERRLLPRKRQSHRWARRKNGWAVTAWNERIHGGP